MIRWSGLREKHGKGLARIINANEQRILRKIQSDAT
jgi:hypothetical protein